MAEKLSSVSEMVDTAIGKSRRLKEGVLKADWEKIVGKICNECQPDYIQNGILYVRAESPVFIHHLNMKKDEYIKKVNSYFNDNIITDVVIRSGKLNENRDEYLNISKEEDNEEIEVPKKSETRKEILSSLNIPDTEDINLGIMEKVAYLQKIAIEREKYLLSHGYKKCKICGMLYEGEEEYCKVCIDSKKVKK